MVKTIFISILLCILVACVYQRPPVVMEQQSPRIVIKEVPAGKYLRAKLGGAMFLSMCQK